MATSRAIAEWNGNLNDGRGTMKPEHAGAVAFSMGTRFGNEAGSNPEELIGAALAGCFSMALSDELEEAGVPPRSIKTEAVVRIDREGWGGSAKSDAPYEILAVELSTEVDAPGMDEARLEQIAEVTSRRCPVARALASLPKISVKATLTSGARQSA
jgi:osmotically inducible protein OsmC